MPGMMWGDFLHFVPPILAANYRHIALVLDDVFAPDTGPYAVNTTELISKMGKHHIEVISPLILNGATDLRKMVKRRGLSDCVVEVLFVETFLQIFTKQAWDCFYKMLYYLGRKGHIHDLKLKEN